MRDMEVRKHINLIWKQTKRKEINAEDASKITTTMN